MTLADRVAQLVAQHGSYRAAGKALGMNHVYLYRIAHSKRGPSADALAKMGLEKIVIYRRVK